MVNIQLPQSTSAIVSHAINEVTNELKNLVFTQGSYTLLPQDKGILWKRGQKTLKSRRMREFAVRLLLLRVSEVIPIVSPT